MSRRDFYRPYKRCDGKRQHFLPAGEVIALGRPRPQYVPKSYRREPTPLPDDGERGELQRNKAVSCTHPASRMRARTPVTSLPSASAVNISAPGKSERKSSSLDRSSSIHKEGYSWGNRAARLEPGYGDVRQKQSQSGLARVFHRTSSAKPVPRPAVTGSSSFVASDMLEERRLRKAIKKYETYSSSARNEYQRQDSDVPIPNSARAERNSLHISATGRRNKITAPSRKTGRYQHAGITGPSCDSSSSHEECQWVINFMRGDCARTANTCWDQPAFPPDGPSTKRKASYFSSVDDSTEQNKENTRSRKRRRRGKTSHKHLAEDTAEQISGFERQEASLEEKIQFGENIADRAKRRNDRTPSKQFQIDYPHRTGRDSSRSRGARNRCTTPAPSLTGRSATFRSRSAEMLKEEPAKTKKRKPEDANSPLHEERSARRRRAIGRRIISTSSESEWENTCASCSCSVDHNETAEKEEYCASNDSQMDFEFDERKCSESGAKIFQRRDYKKVAKRFIKGRRRTTRITEEVLAKDLEIALSKCSVRAFQQSDHLEQHSASVAGNSEIVPSSEQLIESCEGNWSEETTEGRSEQRTSGIVAKLVEMENGVREEESRQGSITFLEKTRCEEQQKDEMIKKNGPKENTVTAIEVCELPAEHSNDSTPMSSARIGPLNETSSSSDARPTYDGRSAVDVSLGTNFHENEPTFLDQDPSEKRCPEAVAERVVASASLDQTVTGLASLSGQSGQVHSHSRLDDAVRSLNQKTSTTASKSENGMNFSELSDSSGSDYLSRVDRIIVQEEQRERNVLKNSVATQTPFEELNSEITAGPNTSKLEENPNCCTSYQSTPSVSSSMPTANFAPSARVLSPPPPALVEERLTTPSLHLSSTLQASNIASSSMTRPGSSPAFSILSSLLAEMPCSQGSLQASYTLTTASSSASAANLESRSCVTSMPDAGFHGEPSDSHFGGLFSVDPSAVRRRGCCRLCRNHGIETPFHPRITCPHLTCPCLKCEKIRNDKKKKPMLRNEILSSVRSTLEQNAPRDIDRLREATANLHTIPSLDSDSTTSDALARWEANRIRQTLFGRNSSLQPELQKKVIEYITLSDDEDDTTDTSSSSSPPLPTSTTEMVLYLVNNRSSKIRTAIKEEILSGASLPKVEESASAEKPSFQSIGFSHSPQYFQQDCPAAVGAIETASDCTRSAAITTSVATNACDTDPQPTLCSVAEPAGRLSLPVHEQYLRPQLTVQQVAGQTQYREETLGGVSFPCSQQPSLSASLFANQARSLSHPTVSSSVACQPVRTASVQQKKLMVSQPFSFAPALSTQDFMSGRNLSREQPHHPTFRAQNSTQFGASDSRVMQCETIPGPQSRLVHYSYRVNEVNQHHLFQTLSQPGAQSSQTLLSGQQHRSSEFDWPFQSNAVLRAPPVLMSHADNRAVPLTDPRNQESYFDIARSLFSQRFAQQGAASTAATHLTQRQAGLQYGEPLPLAQSTPYTNADNLFQVNEASSSNFYGGSHLV